VTDEKEGTMKRIGIVVLLVLTACAEQQTAQPGQPAQQPESPEPVAQEFEVIATEYAFEGVPATLEAGEATFTLVNEGQEPHAMSLAKINDDRPLEELLQLPQKEVQQVIEDAGQAEARPGKSKTFTAELESGRYGYVCFITTEDGTPHAFEGMFGEFTVA
jgi:plastocyanin